MDYGLYVRHRSLIYLTETPRRRTSPARSRISPYLSAEVLVYLLQGTPYSSLFPLSHSGCIYQLFICLPSSSFRLNLASGTVGSARQDAGSSDLAPMLQIPAKLSLSRRVRVVCNTAPSKMQQDATERRPAGSLGPKWLIHM